MQVIEYDLWQDPESSVWVLQGGHLSAPKRFMDEESAIHHARELARPDACSIHEETADGGLRVISCDPLH